MEISGGVAFPNNRERFAPVTLAAKEPIAEFVIDGLFAEAFGFEPGGDYLLGFLGGEAVEKTAIDRGSVVDKALPIGFGIRWLNDLNNW